MFFSQINYANYAIVDFQNIRIQVFYINFRIFYAGATLPFYETSQCSIFHGRVTTVDLCASIVQTERRAWVLVKTRQKHKVIVGAG